MLYQVMMIFGLKTVVSMSSPGEMIAPEISALAPEFEPSLRRFGLLGETEERGLARRRLEGVKKWEMVGLATQAGIRFQTCAQDLEWNGAQKIFLRIATRVAPGILMNWKNTEDRRRSGFNIIEWEKNIVGPTAGPTCDVGKEAYVTACNTAAQQRMTDNTEAIEQNFNANRFMSMFYSDSFDKLFGCARAGTSEICEGYYELACDAEVIAAAEAADAEAADAEAADAEAAE